MYPQDNLQLNPSPPFRKLILHCRSDKMMSIEILIDSCCQLTIHIHIDKSLSNLFFLVALFVAVLDWVFGGREYRLKLSVVVAC